MNILFRLKYFILNWKIGIHLIFGTYRFGVNNKWQSQFNSIFGIPIKQRFNPFILKKRYDSMMFRIFACYFIPLEDAKRLFPRTCKKYNKHNKHT